MQNYCFTTYPPNLHANFFALFCNFSANSLICRCVLGQVFYCAFQGMDLLHLIIIICARNCVCPQSPQGFGASLLLKPQRLFFFLLSAQKKKKQKEKAPAALFCLLRHFSTLNKKNSLRSNSFLFLTLRKAPALNGKKTEAGTGCFSPNIASRVGRGCFLASLHLFFPSEKSFPFFSTCSTSR